MFVFPFSSNEKRRNYGRTENNKKWFANFFIFVECGTKRKTHGKGFRWRRREESRDCLEIFRVGVFFLSRCWQKALRIADIFYYSREKLFVQQMTRPSSLCRLLFLILIAIFIFFHFSCRHIFSNLVCVCVWILNWFAAGWGWINSPQKPPGEFLSFSKPSAVFLFFFQSPSLQTFGRGIITIESEKKIIIIMIMRD